MQARPFEENKKGIKRRGDDFRESSIPKSMKIEGWSKGDLAMEVFTARQELNPE